MRKRNFTSLEVLAEQVRKAELQSLSVKAERKCRSRTSHIWQSRQGVRAEAELHIFGSQCRTKEKTWKLQIFGSKDRAEAELQIFGSQGRAEVRKRNIRSLAVKVEQVWKRNFRSLAVETEWKCGSSTADLWQSSQVGRAEAVLNTFDRPISCWLALPMLKNNTTDCYIEGQCEDHVWLKHMAFAMLVTRSICSCKGSG